MSVTSAFVVQKRNYANNPWTDVMEFRIEPKYPNDRERALFEAKRFCLWRREHNAKACVGYFSDDDREPLVPEDKMEQAASFRVIERTISIDIIDI
jgi:hypothetical protein